MESAQQQAGGRQRRRPGPLARLDRIPVWPYERKLVWVVGAGYFFAFFDIVTISLSDRLGHIGGALAPPTLRGVKSAWGFGSSFLAMGISGFIASALILLGIQATGRSLETAAAG